MTRPGKFDQCKPLKGGEGFPLYNANFLFDIGEFFH